MKLRYIIFLLIAELLFWAQTGNAEAHPVINEVMWAGSDLTPSDEWFELYLPQCKACGTWDLGGWTVTYLKSTGQETLMLTFPAGFMIQPDQYLVIANNVAANSRLLSEPAFVSTSLTLANSGLRLRLKDPSGIVIDEVDDGVGVPFAGSNPSAPTPKASMERIDALVAGTIKENWKTATKSLGLDLGANMLATPGFQNSATLASSSSASSTASVSSTSSSSSASSDFSSSQPESSSFSSSEASSSSSVESLLPDSSSSNSSSSCTSDLVPTITLQSGAFSGVGKVTLNVQATAVEGTMNGATCRFDFGDGYVSESCNPPVHSYDQSGVFSLNLELKNQCGTTLIQSQTVTVLSDGKSTGAPTGVAGSPQAFDDSKIVISGVLPNPDAKDADKEWIELKNLEDRSVPLAGWHLAVGSYNIRRHAIDTVTQISAHDTVRLYQLETGISLSNSKETVELINPQGIVVSSVHYEKTQEGRVYKSETFKESRISGIVKQIVDSEHFVISFDGPSSLLVGENEATVRLIGISSLDSLESSDIYSYKIKSFELNRALIENKKVELYFDSEIWDSSGNLFAYVTADDGRIVQNELLLSGLALADVSYAYASRQDYIDMQKKAMSSGIGIWSIDSILYTYNTDSALNKNKKIVSINRTDISDIPRKYGKIVITEVFPSPSSKESSGSILGEEWIEFFNPEPETISLRGWVLTIGKKSITFGPASVVQSGQHVVLLVHQVGLKLKNDGDNIELRSPDGSYVVSVEYPKTKLGESYVYDESMESYCMSKSPSAGSEGFCGIVPVQTPSRVKKATATKVVKQRKSVYDKYAASYRADLSGEKNDIVIASPESSSTSSFLLVTIGTLFGTLGSIGALSISKVRGWVFG